MFAEAIQISPAEGRLSFSPALDAIFDIGTSLVAELAICKSRVSQHHIAEWSALSPSTTGHGTPKSGFVDLDTPDELALRALLLGIVHRVAGDFASSRHFLADAHDRRAAVTVSTWIAGVAMFELAVLDLKEAEANEVGKTPG